MIFKIQRPLDLKASTDDYKALIYNEDRSIEFMVPMGSMEQFWSDAKNPHKIYVEAELDEDEGFVIDAIVEEQTW